jgi:hypothetical protein
MWNALSRIPAITCKALASPVGFCCGGFPPPPVYVPAKRGPRPEGPSDIASRRLIISSSATRFYPGAQENPPTLPSRPFGRDAGRKWHSQTALLLPSDGASPHPSASPCAGHGSLERGTPVAFPRTTRESPVLRPRGRLDLAAEQQVARTHPPRRAARKPYSVARQKACLASLHRILVIEPVLRFVHHWYNGQSRWERLVVNTVYLRVRGHP